MNNKLLFLILLLTSISLFGMHPIEDYSKCQQPYVKKLRNGDSEAFKKSIIECRAMLWNEDMTSYSSLNYKKFSEKTLTCAGDIHAKEVLRGHQRSLRYAATFYRLAATNGSEDAKVNLVYLDKNEHNIIFIDNTKKSYTKVFNKRKETPTFIQIMDGTKNVKKEDRSAFMGRHQTNMSDYVDSCVNELQKDVLVLEDSQKIFNKIFNEMSAMRYDENGKLMAKKMDEELERHMYIWRNVEDRNLRAQKRMLKGALKEYQKIQSYMDMEKK